MTELMRCPFCGGEAVMKIQKHIPKGYEYTPTCKKSSCAGRLTKKWLNEAEAIEAWNRRAKRTAKVETYTDDQQETWSVCECGTDVWKIFNYCPECGAKLDWSE